MDTVPPENVQIGNVWCLISVGFWPINLDVCYGEMNSNADNNKAEGRKVGNTFQLIVYKIVQKPATNIMPQLILYRFPNNDNDNI